MSSGSDNRADQYVDDAWKEGETPEEARTGVSRNISLRSFPAAYRLGQASPYEGVSHEAGYFTPYRGGASVSHGVTQLFNPSPPDEELENIPSSEGPVIGGEPAQQAMPFPEPLPVSVVSMPQPNYVPQNRDGQVRLPPRNGQYGIPEVQNVASREQNRTQAWFATDNHDDGTAPYCTHVTFQRDMGNFIYADPKTGRPSATWGIPLQSNGMWYGALKHTEGMYGFNTEHFDSEEYEYYLTIPKYLTKALWMVKGMTADAHHEFHEKTVRQRSAQIKADVPRMDFLDAVEGDKWRILHFNFEYSSQVG